MPIQRFSKVHKGQRLSQVCGARPLNAQRRAIMRGDNMALGSGIAAIFNDSFRAYASTSTSPALRVRVVQLTADILPTFETDLEMSSSSSPSSSAVGGALPDNAVEMIFDDATGRWIQPTSPQTLRVVDPYGLVYDSGSIQTVYYDSENDQWVLMPRDTVRIAKTVTDVDGEYPAEVDAPTVYAIKFVDASYDKDAGLQTLTNSVKSTQVADAYCYNLGDGYIAVGDLVLVAWQQGQWYAEVDGGAAADTCCTSDSNSVQTIYDPDADDPSAAMLATDIYTWDVAVGQTITGRGQIKGNWCCLGGTGGAMVVPDAKGIYSATFAFSIIRNCNGELDTYLYDLQEIAKGTTYDGDTTFRGADLEDNFGTISLDFHRQDDDDTLCESTATLRIDHGVIWDWFNVPGSDQCCHWCPDDVTATWAICLSQVECSSCDCRQWVCDSGTCPMNVEIVPSALIATISLGAGAGGSCEPGEGTGCVPLISWDPVTETAIYQTAVDGLDLTCDDGVSHVGFATITITLTKDTVRTQIGAFVIDGGECSCDVTRARGSGGCGGGDYGSIDFNDAGCSTTNSGFLTVEAIAPGVWC